MSSLEIFNAASDVSIRLKKKAELSVVKSTRQKKPVLLEQVSLKLHPDTVREIERIAQDERKLPSEVMRDLIGKGLRVRARDVVPENNSHSRQL